MNSTVTELNARAESQLDASESDAGVRRPPVPRILIFVAIFLTLALSANWLMLAAWNCFHGVTSMPTWQTIPTLLTIGFVGTTVMGMRFTNGILRFVYRICAAWMGLLSWWFFAAVTSGLVFLLSNAFGLAIAPSAIADAFFGFGLVAGVYGLLNASWLRITRVTVKLPNLPVAWHGRSVALVTDLHLGNVRGAGFVRRIVTKLNLLQPEMVFISGDMFDGPMADYAKMAAPLGKLAAPQGGYFVTGNHEEFRDRNQYLDAIQRSGIKVLNNEKVEVAGLQLVGVHDSEATNAGTFSKILETIGLDRLRPSILLAHQPANLEIAADAGISLQLSGHTHGGQMWPWTWAAALIHGRFNRGLNTHADLQVLTSSGVGTWGPPMRVGTKSEIVMLRLDRAAD